MVTREVEIGQKPTKEQIKRLRQADSYPVSYDKDSPQLTDQELAEFRPADPKLYKPRKERISINIDSDVLAAFRASGRGYQTKMNNILRKAVAQGELKDA